MKKMVLIILLIMGDYYYPQIICIKGKEFEIHPIALRAGLEGRFKVNIDVINFKPKINCILHDTNMNFSNYSKGSEYFFDITCRNVEKLVFKKDTTNYDIYLDYHLSRRINNAYAEIISDNEVKLVFPYYFERSTNIVNYVFPDSATLSECTKYIPIEKLKTKYCESNIVLEKKFDEEETVIVVSNNYPELEEYLIKEVINMTKNDFIIKKAKKYLVRFKILREVDECGIREVY